MDLPLNDDLIFTPRTNALLGIEPNPMMAPLQVDPDPSDFPNMNTTALPRQQTQAQQQPHQPQLQLQMQQPQPQSQSQLQQQQIQIQQQEQQPLMGSLQMPGNVNSNQMALLVQTMLNCFQQMTQRINNLESSVTMIQDMLADQKKVGNEVASFVDPVPSPSSSETSLGSSSHHHSPPQTLIAHQPISPHVSNIPLSPESHTSNKVVVAEKLPTHKTAAVSCPSNPTSDWKYDFELVLDGVVDEFYSERPYPPFTVRVMDVATGEVYRAASEWQLRFRLLDGYGRYIDAKLADEKTKTPYLTAGETLVSGLRFMQVSSKNGGYFVLECELQSPAAFVSRVQKVRTQNIIIMSCRLYNQRKNGSFSRLSGVDPVSKLPGIGRQYHQRLCDAGLRTIQDLANLPDSPDGRPVRQQLLDKIRKDQGALTEAKFLDYIKTAKAIVSGAILSRRGDPIDCGDAASYCGEERGVKRGYDYIEQDTQSITRSPDPFGSLRRVANDIPDSTCDQFLNQQLVDSTFDIGNSAIGSYESNPFFFNQSVGAQAITRHVSKEVTRGTEDFDESSCDTYDMDRDRPSKIRRSSSIDIDAVFPLHFAVATGRLQLVQRIIDQTLEINPSKFNELNSQQFTPLMLACALGHDEIVQALVAIEDVDLNRARMDGWTPLHMAALNRHDKCVQILLEKGANPAPSTATSWTPLMMAVIQAHHPLIDLLKHTVSKGRHETGGIGLVHLATLSNDLATFNTVLDALVASQRPEAANPDSRSGILRLIDQHAKIDSCVPTLMHCAAFRGNNSIMKVLIQAGVQSHKISCSGGWLPLHIAAMRGNAECIRLLLQQENVDVDAPTSEGWTALSLAAMASGCEGAAECTEVLLSSGANNNRSTVPASVVSVVCSNLDALMVLANGRPDKMEHTLKINDKQVTVSTRQLGKSMSCKDVVVLCEALSEEGAVSQVSS